MKHCSDNAQNAHIVNNIFLAMVVVSKFVMFPSKCDAECVLETRCGLTNYLSHTSVSSQPNHKATAKLYSFHRSRARSGVLYETFIDTTTTFLPGYRKTLHLFVPICLPSGMDRLPIVTELGNFTFNSQQINMQKVSTHRYKKLNLPKVIYIVFMVFSTRKSKRRGCSVTFSV